MPMHEGEFYRIDKLFPHKTRPNARAYIDDRNLQIHLKEVSEQDPSHSFSKIANDLRSAQVAQAQAGAADSALESERLNQAMKEAKQSFEAMMEFHNKIKEAYQSIVEMQ
jgi:flagellar hook-basal body complex protein FliE